jgi:hypothetical protein
MDPVPNAALVVAGSGVLESHSVPVELQIADAADASASGDGEAAAMLPVAVAGGSNDRALSVWQSPVGQLVLHSSRLRGNVIGRAESRAFDADESASPTAARLLGVDGESCGALRPGVNRALPDAYSAHIAVDKLRGEHVELRAVGVGTAARSQQQTGWQETPGGGASISVASVVESTDVVLHAIGRCERAASAASGFGVAGGSVSDGLPRVLPLSAKKLLAQRCRMVAVALPPLPSASGQSYDQGVEGEQANDTLQTGDVQLSLPASRAPQMVKSTAGPGAVVPAVRIGSLYAQSASLVAFSHVAPLITAARGVDAPHAFYKASTSAAAATATRESTPRAAAATHSPAVVHIEQMHGTLHAHVGLLRDADAFESQSTVASNAHGTAANTRPGAALLRIDNITGSVRAAVASSASPYVILAAPGVAIGEHSRHAVQPASIAAQKLLGSDGMPAAPSVSLHYDSARDHSMVVVEDADGSIDITLLASGELRGGGTADNGRASADSAHSGTAALAGAGGALGVEAAPAVWLDLTVYSPSRIRGGASEDATCESALPSEETHLVQINAPATLAQWTRAPPGVSQLAQQAMAGKPLPVTLQELRVRGLLHLSPAPEAAGLIAAHGGDSSVGSGAGGSSAVQAASHNSPLLSPFTPATSGGSGKIRTGVPTVGFYSSNSSSGSSCASHVSRGDERLRTERSATGYPSITCVVGSQLLHGIAIFDGSSAATKAPEVALPTAVAAAEAAATTTHAAAAAAAVTLGVSAGSTSPSRSPRIRVSVLDWPTLIRRRMAARAASGAGAAHA